MSAYTFNWTVNLMKDGEYVKGSYGLPNFGNGTTPDAALQNLKQAWIETRDENSAALAMLADALRGSPLGSAT